MRYNSISKRLKKKVIPWEKYVTSMVSLRSMHECACHEKVSVEL